MFELTNIRSGDRKLLARTEQFLLDNADPGVRPRPKEQIERAVDVGQGLILFDGDNICGVSLVYPYDVPPSGPIYSEIGTMRITANGNDLQTFLAKFHLLQIVFEEYEAGETPAVFAVVTPGTASAHNLGNKVGMIQWVPPKELAVVRSAAGVPFSSGKEVLFASSSCFSSAIQDLKKLYQANNIFACPKGSERVRVNLGWFNEEVLALSI
jgi:hypothetical protein